MGESTACRCHRTGAGCIGCGAVPCCATLWCVVCCVAAGIIEKQRADRQFEHIEFGAVSCCAMPCWVVLCAVLLQALLRSGELTGSLNTLGQHCVRHWTVGVSLAVEQANAAVLALLLFIHVARRSAFVNI